MFAVLRFLFFNVLLSTTDVGTDFFTFLELVVDNPRWAFLTLLWTIMPFLVQTAFFVYKRATGKCEACPTWTKLMKEFYKEAGSHLPFVSSLHNIWRSIRLHQLNYGTKDFQMKDHKEVEKLLDEAGRCSQGESNYEAGPQSVTQVKHFSHIDCCHIKAYLSTDGNRAKYWQSEHDPDRLTLHLRLELIMGSRQVQTSLRTLSLTTFLPPGRT